MKVGKVGRLTVIVCNRDLQARHSQREVVECGGGLGSLQVGLRGRKRLGNRGRMGRESREIKYKGRDKYEGSGLVVVVREEV